MGVFMDIKWKRNIILFLTSQSISLFGSMLVQYAITWYITLEIPMSTYFLYFTNIFYIDFCRRVGRSLQSENINYYIGFNDCNSDFNFSYFVFKWL